MRIVVTGANGFVGRALVARLLDGTPIIQGQPLTRLALIDSEFDRLDDPRMVRLTGDLADRKTLDEALGSGVDVIFHLASLPGGASEANLDPGHSVNVDATIALAKAAAKQSRPCRLVFTSSIAVFGTPLPDRIDDATLPQPTMSYGAQKLMMEIYLSDITRRGMIDARCVRLPGIIVRPRQRSGHISAFLSEVFHALAAGEEFRCPVGPNATTWLMSRPCCVENLIHAARLDAERLPSWRAWTLPALRISMRELIEDIAKRVGADTPRQVRYEPNENVEAQFGRYPPLATAIADSLGFAHDGAVSSLVDRVFADAITNSHALKKAG